MHTKQRKNLSEIFKALDSDDNDGQISAKKINISALSLDLLQVFKPLLKEMEALGAGTTLDIEEFVESSLALYQVIFCSYLSFHRL